MKKVTIIGSGFAALTAVKTLRTGNSDIEITVVSPKAEMQYLPSSIWIPSGKRKPEDILVSLDKFFKRMNITHHAAKATGLTNQGRTLQTDNGDIENDGLIICSGGRFLKKLPGIENAITPCEGIEASIKIRDRLLEMDGGNIAFGFASNPKEPSAMRGGPMFEFLFGIDHQLRDEGRRDKFNLSFFTPAPSPGQRLGPKAVQGIIGEMAKRNIKTYLGSKLKKFSEDSVETETDTFAADLIIFMPGMTGNHWFKNTELPLSEGGMLKANSKCQIEGFKHTYVAGDSGSYPGPDWMPKQAHMADLQAEAAAVNLLAEFDNKTPTEEFKVELMCIIDSQNKGMLVVRNQKRNIVLPSFRLFHWLKRFFEWWYLRQYR
ncbi:MAG: FAD-dependent oxidoreductase [Gammaproteobacteria bacterium]|nr:FAD-dependent oxidoreductase [Gammaproteobacteria bacterium]